MATEEPKASNSGRWQFSLRTLLMAVTLFSLACFAMTNADILWVFTGTFSFTMMWASLALTFGVVLPPGRWQWFWVGCGLSAYLFVCIYFVLASIALSMEINSGLSSQIPWTPNSSFFSFPVLAAVPSSLLGGLLARHFYTTRADES